jgi:hypothetical protein
MIIKPRTVPVNLLQVEALNERLPGSHIAKELVGDELCRRLAGYKGEMNLNYPLSFLSPEDFLILHHLRLFDGTHHFQMDTVIITEKYILILETKNISGTLNFDTEFNQLIRSNEKGEEAFSDPLMQVKRHKAQLRKWLACLNLSHLPIESLVVISNPRTIIRSTSNHVHQKVIHSGQLPFQIEALQEKYKRQHLQKEEAFNLANEMMKNHRPQVVDVLKKYGITSEELIKGVKCPHCSYVPCKRAYGKWTCRKCGADSKDAHVDALRDYALLLGTDVTNGAVKRFLGIESGATVNRILVSLNVSSKGSGRWKIHSLRGLINWN